MTLLKQIEAAKNATPAPTAAPEVTETPQVSYAGLVNVVIGDKNVSDVSLCCAPTVGLW